MHDLLTRQGFAEHLNSVFKLSCGDDDTVDFNLVEATDKTPDGFSGEQFSLIFQGPHEPQLQQQIYAMEHAEMGRLELFLVPIGEPTSGRLYEAYFNRPENDEA